MQEDTLRRHLTFIWSNVFLSGETKGISVKIIVLRISSDVNSNFPLIIYIYKTDNLILIKKREELLD